MAKDHSEGFEVLKRELLKMQEKNEERFSVLEANMVAAQSKLEKANEVLELVMDKAGVLSFGSVDSLELTSPFDFHPSRSLSVPDRTLSPLTPKLQWLKINGLDIRREVINVSPEVKKSTLEATVRRFFVEALSMPEKDFNALSICDIQTSDNTISSFTPNDTKVSQIEPVGVPFVLIAFERPDDVEIVKKYAPAAEIQNFIFDEHDGITSARSESELVTFGNRKKKKWKLKAG